ncbi:MAG: SDR family oxidoreductase [Novosphingobium sp.]|nr:SDR family oxidoreductase [Novosphingobium sp.]
MTEARLAGQSALVTGGAGGFGLACAMLLARDGAAVTLMGRTEAKLEEAKAKIVAAYPEAKVQVCAGDAMSEAEVGAAMDLAASGPDRFGIVVATVGGSRSRGFVETDADAFMDTVAWNARPAYIAIREGIQRIDRGGAFAFISSTAAEIPFDGMPGYCAGKAALDMLVKEAAHELGHLGHRFNAVRPGLTRTGATPALFANAQMMRRFEERIPLGRAGEPEEIAEAVRFLVGPEASWTTGQSFAVDGGNELRGAPDMSAR